MTVYALAELLGAGKTKEIVAVIGHPTLAAIRSKDDITKLDGAKHDSFPGKGKVATVTTSAVFSLLNACGIKTAFKERTNDMIFIADRCTMLPYEIVVRREAPPKSSYLKRNPLATPGVRFEALVVEFFLKTNDKTFGGITVPKDDPFVVSFGLHGVDVVRPDMPIGDERVRIPPEIIYGKDADVGHPFADMEQLARQVFLVLESAWAQQRCKLVDLKIECGITADGRLVVADVVDNDSWRLFGPDGKHLDKQRYRDGASMEEVEALYRQVKTRVERFAELHAQPQIILWCASERDDHEPFLKEHARLGLLVQMKRLTGSVHKRPELCLRTLREEIAQNPADTVVIAYVGRSNGAGPVFAADTNVPVIAVPASAGSFPDDVWSSLRMPSDLPMMVVMDPANAVQAALGILSMKSPHAYLARRMVVESAHLDSSNSPTFGRG
ncbi:hypothetical protein FJY94_04040 [Candidatus Kaiserbacteria bacterium]|nr:hypothetical protein [Candidatus Kaiserbacteria bacterium]